MGVGFAALQRHAHGDLSERASRKRVCSRERLRSEYDMNAERSALADQSVEQERRRLRHTVVLDEELLKLVNDEQDPRQHRLGILVAVGRRYPARSPGERVRRVPAALRLAVAER